MKESEIRDLLIQNLNIIDEKYQLLDKEAYLPSKIGTRSFIDILAHNGKGQYVIIELKKSNTSAREALHELLKYYEAVKENLAIKSDEIELVIISTEWDELYVPFSSFVSAIDIHAIGYKLFISSENVLSAKQIVAAATSPIRTISSVQMARYYGSEQDLERGVQEHIHCFKAHRIDNFLLLILKAPHDYREKVIQSVKQSLTSLNENLKMSDCERLVPEYKFIIYSVNQLLSLKDYFEILSSYPELSDEVEEVITSEISNPIHKMELLNELLLNCEPFPEAYTEFGSPAKYDMFREKEGWDLVEIKRYGSLANNIILSDERVESEIKGSGTTRERYVSKIDFSNRASISRVKDEIGFCLTDNVVWKNHIFTILDTIVDEFAGKQILSSDCSIYNPMNIIYSIFLILAHDPAEGLLYIPSYRLQVELENETRVFFGYIDGEIKDIPLNVLLTSFWDFGKDGFLLSLTKTGYTANNLEVCETIGLKYETLMVTVNKETNVHQVYKYINYKFSETEPFIPSITFYEQLLTNKFLVPQIMEFFNKHDFNNGGFQM